MDLSINFLLQTVRILHVGNYDDNELEMVYKFISKLDNEILNHYLNSKSVLAYSSDLELCVEIITALIGIYEEREEYEKCYTLKLKKEESITILNN